MPETNIQLLDVVALTVDLPVYGLTCGQVGTVVEILRPDAFEVEFADDQGRTYAQLAVKPDHLLVLRYRPQKAG